MKELLFEMVTEQNFLLFILGAFGVPFFRCVHKKLSTCNTNVFSGVCTVLTYFLITYLLA